MPSGQDPFYLPPAGFAARSPGTVLRTRPVRIALAGLVPQRVAAWQVLYRTCDLNGVPDTTVTTVVVPPVRAGAEGRLLAYQCAIDAISSRCFPSYALQLGARAAGAVPQVEWLFMADALRRGWVLTISDHEGPLGSFGAPREPGYRALDAIRATLAFAPAGLAPDTPVAAWGYSGGGMATSWTAELAPSYAPEIDLVGAVLGSPVGDPGDTFGRLNGKAFAGLALLVLAALRHVYPELNQLLRINLDPAGIAALDRIETCTTTGALIRYRDFDLGKYVDESMVALLESPPVPALYDELRLGQHPPACPLLVQQAVHDEIIAVVEVDNQVERYRRAGAQVEYRRAAVGGHLTEMFLAAPGALVWLADRFAGRAPGPSVTRTVSPRPPTLAGVRGLLRLADTAVRVLVGRPVADPQLATLARFTRRHRAAA